MKVTKKFLRSRPTSFEESERILDLEQEQEKLTGSLLALTSHFGQVQFRLKQIIEWVEIIYLI